MARRARDHRFRAPPPSPIATAKGLRSAAVNDAVLSDYLGESLRVPDLALPESHFPSKPPLKNPPEVDYRSLIRGDDSSVRQVLAAAKDAGVVLVGGGGESLAEEARAAINSGRGVFAKPTAERTKGDLGQRWFGRRDGIGEEFYWYRLRSTETERLLRLTWPDSYATLGEKMETVSVRLQNVAECIAKILFEHVTCQTPSKRIGKVQSILCLRKRESHHVQNDASELADPKLHYSDALSLHISGEDHEFCIRQLEGSTIFMMQAGDILVTIGKPLQEWSNGELKSASAEALFQPLDDQVVSFSLEYLCSPHVLSHDPDQGTATISLTDQLLVVLILAVLYKIWSFVFS